MTIQQSIREDVLNAATCALTRERLTDQTIAVSGGTGFLGTWIAETVAALNDVYKTAINLHLYARGTEAWKQMNPHLASRGDIHLHMQDVRSPFEFPAATSFIIHAAGIPDNRVHASDPLKVFETTVNGTRHALEAAGQLGGLRKFVHISSGLVRDDNINEPGKTHFVYRDAKFSAESLCAIFRSQLRLPVSTIRPYTFIGPYQELNRPWAVNNFINDALGGKEIRLHGEGQSRRSYLYGSDAAWWTLMILARGGDGKAYSIGGSEAINLRDLAERIASKITPTPDIILRTVSAAQQHNQDFLPDLAPLKQELGSKESCSLDAALDKAITWYRATSL